MARREGVEELREAVAKLTAERDALLAELDDEEEGAERGVLGRLRTENSEVAPAHVSGWPSRVTW